MSKEISYSRRLAAASGLCLAVPAIAALGAEHKSDGIYLGKRVLIKGSDPYCPAEDDVSIIIHGETLLFTDSALQKVRIMFYPSPDGSFGEISTGERGETVEIHGRIVGDFIEADITNSPCKHHWHLKKE